MRHTFEAHSSVPNFSFTCGVEGCSQTFSTYSAMKSHLSRRHRGVDFDEVQSTPIQCQDGHPPSTDLDTFQLSDDEPCQETQYSNTDRLQRSAALFLLSLKEQHQNTQRAVDFAVGQVQQMVSYAVEDIKKSVMSTLEEHSAATGSDSLDVSSCFEIPDPFSALHTEYLQTKYYKKHFNLVVSQHVIDNSEFQCAPVAFPLFILGKQA